MAVEFKVRDTNSLVGSVGQLQPATIDLFGNIQVTDLVTKSLLQGRVFIGGYGIEDTTADGEVSLDDTTPTYILRAPDGGGIITVPLWVRIQMTTEGGAAPDAYLAFVNGMGASISYSSGTALNAINALGGCAIKAQSRFVIGPAVIGAVANSQNVLLYRNANLLDNLISVEAATTKMPDNVAGDTTTFRMPLFPQIPIALYKGSMLSLIHI